MTAAAPSWLARPAPSARSDVRRVAVRTGLAVGLVVMAYSTSLWTLLRGVAVDTPLAHLGLVPLVAAGLILTLARPRAGEPEIHDRHLDLIVGVPLVVFSVTCLVVLPVRLSTMYWLWRIDLLTLPLFAAGVIAMLFGTRMLWRVRAGVLFLFLAWPVPFRWLVSATLDPLTERTAWAVSKVLALVPLAVPVVGDGAAFDIPFEAEPFRVQVASACSGANSLLGFVLVASALAIVLRGSRAAKFAWVLAGSALVVGLNVARILAIIAVGRRFGERAAIDVLHPYVGLFAFSVGVLVMVLVSPRFGLELPYRQGPDRTAATLSAVARPAPLLVAGLVLVSLLAGVVDSRLTDFDPIASSLGSPRLAAFSKIGTKPDGFYAEPVASLDEGKRFFGEDSSWIRYSYAGRGIDGLRSNVPVLADVISSTNLQAFSDFGLEACYRFHGYGPQGVRTVSLGKGVVGTVLGWTDSRSGVQWTGVYWVWPVRSGADVRYERVVMMLTDSRTAELEAPELTRDNAEDYAVLASELVGGDDSGGIDEAERTRRAFLVQFSRNVVSSATERAQLVPAPKEIGG